MSSAFARILPFRKRLIQSTFHNKGSLRTRLFSFYVKETPKRFVINRANLAFAGVLAGGLLVSYKFYGLNTLNQVKCEDSESPTVEENEESIILYQFASCPFCNKVRTFLDYYGLKYKIVEVDPLFKSEIKFSSYRKVPIVVIQDIQLNDSSLIISILRSYLLKQDSLEQLLQYYPPITVQGSSGKDTVEYANRYGIMYKKDFNERDLQKIKLERKWRKWVDDTFVHTLSPNIYRTWREAMEASEYFSHVGEFTATQRFLAKYVGAVVMYYVGRKMKRKYRLKDDVREAMYDEVRTFMKALGKRKFLGGKHPNLADLAMFGVLRGIEGLTTMDDLKKYTDIKPWFDRMKHVVETHQGAALH